eukprot:TRINITY_DN5444_c0_g1_i10.p1 TRINITY_DN5444_c0_g1~~TRINITY_DN5444_c0_g1_i10.p1  ORF type:complete len:569 (+),score=101.38 TRINITY_DN5444_c0_g1_i10:120-1826(+)
MLIALLFMLGVCQAVPSFYALYDLAIQNAINAARDLMGNGPTMTGGEYVPYGVKFSESNWLDANGKPFSISFDTSKELTIIAVIKPRKCKKTEGIFHFSFAHSSAQSKFDDVIYPNCELRCYDSLWYVACMKSSGNGSVSNYVNITPSEFAAFGLSFSVESMTNAVKMVFLYENRTIDFGYVLGDDKDALKGVTIEYDVSATEVLYYLGIVDQAVKFFELEKLIESMQNPEKEISCTNCIVSSESLQCSNTKLNSIPYKMREYFCTCPEDFGFDIALNECTKATRSCTLDCMHGCKEDISLNCLFTCPEDFVVAEVLGDFVGCECAFDGLCGGITLDSKMSDMGGSDGVIDTSTIIIIVAIIGSVLLLILIAILVMKCVEYLHGKKMISKVEVCLEENKSAIENCDGIKEERKAADSTGLNSTPSPLSENDIKIREYSSLEEAESIFEDMKQETQRHKIVSFIQPEHKSVHDLINSQSMYEKRNSFNSPINHKSLKILVHEEQKKPIDKQSSIRENDCTICCNKYDENRRQIVLLPCGHKMVCELCYEKLEDECPFDRKDVKGYDYVT